MDTSSLIAPLFEFVLFFIVTFCRFMSTAVLLRTNTFQHQIFLYFSMVSAFIHNLCRNRIQLYPRKPVDKLILLKPVFFNMLVVFFNLSRVSYPQIFLMVFLLFLPFVRTIYYFQILLLFEAQYVIYPLPNRTCHLLLIFLI